MKNKIVKFQILISVILGASGIILGAFSAHGLENFLRSGIIDRHDLEVFEKGIKYQMYTAFTLLILSIANKFLSKQYFYWSYWLIFAGCLFFSGSVYFIALKKITEISFPSYLFWITPLGGLLMIVGWLLIFFEFKKGDL